MLMTDKGKMIDKEAMTNMGKMTTSGETTEWKMTERVEMTNMGEATDTWDDGRGNDGHCVLWHFPVEAPSTYRWAFCCNCQGGEIA